MLARLPEERVCGLYDLWPKLFGEPCRHLRPAAAAPEAIDRTNDLPGLNPDEQPSQSSQLGIGRTTAWQRWTTALLKIAIRLNAAAEQIRPNVKPLNTRPDFVLESG